MQINALLVITVPCNIIEILIMFPYNDKNQIGMHYSVKRSYLPYILLQHSEQSYDINGDCSRNPNLWLPW